MNSKLHFIERTLHDKKEECQFIWDEIASRMRKAERDGLPLLTAELAKEAEDCQQYIARLDEAEQLMRDLSTWFRSQPGGQK